jgi:Protein of unknown function (DUF3226)
MAKWHPKKLLVEGQEDKRVIPYLIEAATGIPWSSPDGQVAVFIQPYDGLENLLTPGLIETELKASGLVMLGILADADDNAEDCWRRIRQRCVASFPNIPEVLPETGLVQANADGLTIGVWVMPDNRLRGMLETFLAYLVPDTSQLLWQQAVKAFEEAKRLGAPCKAGHADKAKIHTWLSWQDPPGRQLHNAVIERMLDPTSSYATGFVSWFRTLYNI